MPYKTVLVGTDGSETASEAVRQAAELAKAAGAQLVIVSAFSAASDHGSSDPSDHMSWQLTDASAAEEKAGSGREIARKIGVKTVRTRVDRGDPAEVLIDTADDVNADLIVVGSKGMTSAKRFVLGSVPNKVSHHAPCDLAIVHTA